MENTRIGPFLIIKRLGTNRRQKVFHAQQVIQKRDVALKFISVPPTVNWNRAVDKINIEVDVLKQLTHPKLVQLHGAGVVDEKIFLAHELAPGESMTAMLSRRGRLAPDLVVEIGRQIAELLQFLHQQDVIHARLTPDKIIVDKNHKVKVADLRLNRSKRKRWDSGQKRELDVAAYMAPEQFTEGASNKSDIYSLGVILYEMLTGKLPYEPDTMGRMNRKKMEQAVPSVASNVMNCPVWLDKIVCQMLDPEPRNRPHSARAVVFALDEIKNIDSTKKAAVSQVTGNFNPLTAGTDKTEANRLLGKKTKKRPEKDRPFYESVPFLLGCLVMIAIISGIALRPTSSKTLFSSAAEMMDSDELAQWRTARTNLKTIMERGKDDEFFEPATELYFESRRRTMVEQAERGQPLWTQSENTIRIGKAIKLQRDNQLEQAKREFSILTTLVDPKGDERHIFLEAQNRLAAIKYATTLPTDVDELTKLIDQLTEVEDLSAISESKQKLADIIFAYSGKENYDSIVLLAESSMNLLRQKRDKLDPSGLTPSRENPASGETLKDKD